MRYPHGVAGYRGVERCAGAFREHAQESTKHDDVGVQQIDGVAKRDAEVLRLVRNGFRCRLADLCLQASNASAMARCGTADVGVP